MKHNSKALDVTAVIFVHTLREKQGGASVRLSRGQRGLARNYWASPWRLNLTALGETNKSESSGLAKWAQPALPSVHRLRSTKYASR